MKNVIILSLALGIVCTVAATVLGFAELNTRKERATAKRESDLAAVKKILPDFDNNPLADKVTKKTDARPVTIMKAKRDDNVVAYAVQASAQGYGGKLTVMVGVKPDGEILHVVVLPGHQETPGLGTKATNRRATKTITDILDKDADKNQKQTGGLAPNKYLQQYAQHNLLRKTTYKVKKDGGTIDAVSGATISSRAVARAVSQAAIGFQAFLENDPKNSTAID